MSTNLSNPSSGGSYYRDEKGVLHAVDEAPQVETVEQTEAEPVTTTPVKEK